LVARGRKPAIFRVCHRTWLSRFRLLIAAHNKF
jgi:hypothetical protein